MRSTLGAAILALSILACRSNSHSRPAPSLDKADNARWVHEACPDAARPNFVIGREQIACCAGSKFWFPHDCVDKRTNDRPEDNFCGQTPIGGSLIIEPDGVWWCCGDGQCGN